MRCGERVHIRRMTEADLMGDTSWARLPAPLLRQRFETARADPTQGLFIVANERGERIGRAEYIAYRPEKAHARCNLYLAEKFTGRGYGTDSLRTLSAHLFDTLEIDEIGCRVHVENLRSVRCCRKCGYVIRGQEKGLYIMALSRHSFQSALRSGAHGDAVHGHFIND